MQFFINDTYVDLIPGESILFRLSNAEIGNPGNRSGSWTNDFKAVLNPSTQETIGYADSLQSSNSFDTQKKHAAYLKNANGSEVARGYAQIVEIDKRAKTITFTFFGGNTPWIDELRGKSIRDIWLWNLQHDWTEANIAASWSNTDGYIYPFIDYGRLTFQTDAYTFVNDWYPAMFQHTLIRRMIEAINWKVSGDIVDSWAYKHTIIPFVNERFVEDSEFQIPAEAEKTSTTGYDLTATPASGTSDSSTEVIQIDTIVTDELGAFDLGNNRYVAQKALNDAVFVATMSQTLVRRSTSNASFTDFDITWSIRKNGTAVVTQTLLSEDNISGSPADNSTTDNFTLSATMDLVTSDYVDVVIDFSYTDAVASSTIIQLLVQVADFNFQLTEVDDEIAVSGNVTLHNNLPDLDQADFIKDVIVRHGALVTVDPFSQTIYLNSTEQVLKQGETATDWSDRVDLNGISNINFTEIVTKYGKKSFFKYAAPSEDDEYVKSYNDGRELGLGDGKLDIDNDFIEGERTIYTSIFSPTLQIESAIDEFFDDSYYIPYIPRVSYDGSQTLRANPRILYVVQNTEVSDFTKVSSIIEIDGTNYTQTAFAYFAKPRLNSDLDFLNETLAYDTPDINSPDDGLLTKNYAGWLRILLDPNYVRLSVKLWEHEFSNVDLTNLVEIQNTEIQGLFLIDQVEYSGDGDEVRLIQVK